MQEYAPHNLLALSQCAYNGLSCVIKREDSQDKVITPGLLIAKNIKSMWFKTVSNHNLVSQHSNQ